MTPIAPSPSPRRWRLTLPVLCGSVALMLTACSAAGTPELPEAATEIETAAEVEDGAEADDAAEAEDDAAEQTDAGDSGLSAADIIAVVEPHGFGCVEEEPVLSSRIEKVVCKGDNYAYITATKLADEGDMDNQMTKAKEALCGSEFTDEDDAMRTAVSGAWVLVPGGGDENNIALYDAAMTDLGLEWTADSCGA